MDLVILGHHRKKQGQRESDPYTHSSQALMRGSSVTSGICRSHHYVKSLCDKRNSNDKSLPVMMLPGISFPQQPVFTITNPSKSLLFVRSVANKSHTLVMCCVTF